MFVFFKPHSMYFFSKTLRVSQSAFIAFEIGCAYLTNPGTAFPTHIFCLLISNKYVEISFYIVCFLLFSCLFVFTKE